MTIDASIPLKSIAPDPQEVQMNRLKIQAAQQDMADADLKRSQLGALNSAYTATYNDAQANGGQLDPDTLMSNLGRAGIGSQIPAQLKALYEARGSQLKFDSDFFDYHSKLAGVAASIAGSALADPNATPESVQQRILQARASGLLDDASASQMYRNVPPGGPGFRNWLMTAATQNEQGQKALDALAKANGKPELVNSGDANQFALASPVTGEVTMLGSPIPTTVSPNTVYTQRHEDARHAETMALGQSRLESAGAPHLTLAARTLKAEMLLGGANPREVMLGISRSPGDIIALNNLVADMAASRGIDAGAIMQRMLAYASDRKFIDTATGKEALIAGQERAVTGAADLVRQAMHDYPQSNLTDLNAVKQWFDLHSSDKTVAVYRANLMTLIGEYAKLTQGGQATDATRAEAIKLLNPYYSAGGMEAVLNAIQAEAKNSEGAYRGVVEDRGRDLAERTRNPPPATPSPATPKPATPAPGAAQVAEFPPDNTPANRAAVQALPKGAHYRFRTDPPGAVRIKR